MTLPFLEPKKISSVIMAKTKPDGGVEPDMDDPNAGLHSAAQDLLSAIEAKDVAGVASALSAAHDINSSSEPDGDDDELG